MFIIRMIFTNPSGSWFSGVIDAVFKSCSCNIGSPGCLLNSVCLWF